MSFGVLSFYYFSKVISILADLYLPHLDTSYAHFVNLIGSVAIEPFLFTSVICLTVSLFSFPTRNRTSYMFRHSKRLGQAVMIVSGFFLFNTLLNNLYIDPGAVPNGQRIIASIIIGKYLSSMMPLTNSLFPQDALQTRQPFELALLYLAIFLASFALWRSSSSSSVKNKQNLFFEIFIVLVGIVWLFALTLIIFDPYWTDFPVTALQNYYRFLVWFTNFDLLIVSSIILVSSTFIWVVVQKCPR